MSLAKNVLPSGYRQYGLQVAGHKPTDVGKEALGVVEEARTGLLLKPLQSKGRGEVERAFYEEVEAGHPHLAAFLPAYHGTRQLCVNGKETAFLVLENLTQPFRKPCILDVKVGAQTWEPGASEEKVRREQSKYPWGKELGWRVLGLKTKAKSSEEYESRGKAYGRSLAISEVPSMLELFFGRGERSLEAVHSLLARLRLIEAWFASQTHFQIYSSSLLLIYEGDAERPVLTDVRMIDFAHVGRERRLDENYRRGLASFARHLADFARTLPTPPS